MTELFEKIKNRGSVDNKDHLAAAEFFSSLRQSGFTLEEKLNQPIQGLLNDDQLVKSAANLTGFLTYNLRDLQKHIEALATIFLIPTKNDVANVAKLTLQTEEKVDRLEEHLIKLIGLMQYGESDGEQIEESPQLTTNKGNTQEENHPVQNAQKIQEGGLVGNV